MARYLHNGSGGQNSELCLLPLITSTTKTPPPLLPDCSRRVKLGNSMSFDLPVFLTQQNGQREKCAHGDRRDNCEHRCDKPSQPNLTRYFH